MTEQNLPEKEHSNAKGLDIEDTRLKHDLVRMKLAGMGGGVISGLGFLSMESSWSLYFAYLSFAAACAVNMTGYYLYISLQLNPDSHTKRRADFNTKLGVVALWFLVISVLLFVWSGATLFFD